MLPVERKQKILLWLEQEGTLRVSDISKRLNISEMTVYRDLKPLIEDQRILKTSNGISLINKNDVSSNNCTYCFKVSNTRLSVQLIKTNNQVERTCCPHCGLLRYHSIEENVSQIICRDFLRDTTISARTATYVLDAAIDLNCCKPQAIAFESRKQAEQFQLGFGGIVYSFHEAIQAIKSGMASSGCCHMQKRK